MNLWVIVAPIVPNVSKFALDTKPKGPSLIWGEVVKDKEIRALKL